MPVYADAADRRCIQALHWALPQLRQRAKAVFVRQPLLDPLLPDTADIDLLAFGDVPALLPERLWPPDAPPVDIIWLPAAMLEDAQRLARWGLIAHRLAGSAPIFHCDERSLQGAEQAVAQLRTPSIQAARLNGIFEMGWATVYEIGVSWDFPSLARLWLQIAWSALLAVAADAAGRLAPNVYTRPFDALASIDPPIGTRLAAFAPHLQLDTKAVEALIAATDRLHTCVTRSFPEPQWPAGYRADTAQEYRYYASRRELDWRLGVVREMLAREQQQAAVAYLRFWAYSLARIPVVHDCALHNIDTAFGRPLRPMRAELERLCPPALEELQTVLGADCQRAQIEQALPQLTELRDAVIDDAIGRDIPLGRPRPWAPWRAEAHPPSRSASSP